MSLTNVSALIMPRYRTECLFFNSSFSKTKQINSVLSNLIISVLAALIMSSFSDNYSDTNFNVACVLDFETGKPFSVKVKEVSSANWIA